MDFSQSWSRAKHTSLANFSFQNETAATRVRSARMARTWIVCIFSVLITLVIFLYPNSRTSSNRLNTTSDDSIFNRTLGFHRNYVLSLPARTDRREKFQVAASFAGFDVEFIDGVLSEDVSSKATPLNWKAENVGPGVLGSWRGHMNVLQKIVNENIQTALIWEDDADFDPALKQQLQKFATGVKALLPSTSSSSSSSPYGRGWDFLWLGHSKLGPSDNQTEFYVLENDQTTPAVRNRYGKWWNHKHSPLEASEDTTRLIFKAGNGGVGMYAYAVTYESARKALVALSVIPRDGAVDVAYRNFCKGAFGIEFACYGPFPTLIGTHRAAGWAERSSDNNVGEKGRWVDEVTADVKFSTMLNLQRLANEDEFVEAQWAGEDGKKELRRVNEPLNGAVGGLRNIDLLSAPPPSWMPSDAR